MQYNEDLYNGSGYNLTNYSSTLSETVTPSDAALAFSVGIVKTDSQGTADLLSDGVSLAAMMDTVTIYQRARTPFAYNNGMYDMFMYNARLDEDEILLMANKVFGDFFTLTDSLQPFLIIKNLTETFTEVDVLTMAMEIMFTESLFLSDYARAEITNKALSGIVRLSDWLSIERNPPTNDWSN